VTSAQEADEEADVCVVGAGPAGLVLGLVLARAGVRVTVLEKHADFLRDFRGDTVHPSTLDVLAGLGLSDRLAELPGRRVTEFTAAFADGTFRLVDFTRLPVAHPYVLFLPQWDLLELLAATAAGYPGFTLLRSHEVTDLLFDGAGGPVRGVVARTGDGRRAEIRARLVVAADGRHSTVRAALDHAGRGLPRREFGAPMDVLWFRLPRWPDDPVGLGARVGAGRLLIMIDRGHYWQTAYVIPKGGRDAAVAAGLDELRATVLELAPWLDGRVDVLSDWDELAFLEVRVDRLRRWHSPGVLCIGDAAHAMSPIDSVGINLAVQDAVAAGRMLAGPLLAGATAQQLTPALARLQRRRTLPTVGTQFLQRAAARGLIGPTLRANTPVKAPAAIRLLDRVPLLRALPAWIVGVGLLPERLSPEAAPDRIGHQAGARRRQSGRDGTEPAALS